MNKESRRVTLRLHTLAFGVPGGDSRVYFSFAPTPLYSLAMPSWIILHQSRARSASAYQRSRTQDRRLRRPRGCRREHRLPFPAERCRSNPDWRLDERATPEQQVVAVFASPRAVLDTVSLRLSRSSFCRLPPAAKSAQVQATRTVLGSPKPLYKVTGRTSRGKRDRSPSQTGLR